MYPKLHPIQFLTSDKHLNDIFNNKRHLWSKSLKNIPVCFDKGLHTRAQEIVWSKQDKLSGEVPPEEGLHMLMSIFSATGF